MENNLDWSGVISSTTIRGFFNLLSETNATRILDSSLINCSSVIPSFLTLRERYLTKSNPMTQRNTCALILSSRLCHIGVTESKACLSTNENHFDEHFSVIGHGDLVHGPIQFIREDCIFPNPLKSFISAFSSTQ